MSQGLLSIANQSGALFRAALNAALARLATRASGTTRPADIGTYEDWVDTDTPGGGIGTWYLYDGTTDIVLGLINTTTHAVIGFAQRAYLAGLGLSAAGGTATFGVAAGVATDSTNLVSLSLASAYTKTTASWAVGSGNGALDTGAIATSTWYHVWLIQRPDTGVVDVLVSLSASAPTMPGAGAYTLKRRIGAMKTDGSSQWVKFVQDGDLFRWDQLAAVYDSGANPGTSAIDATLDVPTGIKVRARLLVKPVFATTGSAVLYISDKATTAQAPAEAATPLGLGSATSAPGGLTPGVFYEERTDTAAKVRLQLSASGASDRVYISTIGWIDRRGRDD